MFKIGKSKKTGEYLILELRNSKWDRYNCGWDEQSFKAVLKRLKRNRFKREQNEILSDLCGTSARAAREDMGLPKS